MNDILDDPEEWGIEINEDVLSLNFDELDDRTIDSLLRTRPHMEEWDDNDEGDYDPAY